MKRLIPLLLLAGCATTPKVAPTPIIVPVEVLAPIAGACVPDTLKAPPEYVDTKDKLVAAQDAAERYQLVLGGRAQRIARLNELEPIIAACPKGSSK